MDSTNAMAVSLAPSSPGASPIELASTPPEPVLMATTEPVPPSRRMAAMAVQPPKEIFVCRRDWSTLPPAMTDFLMVAPDTVVLPCSKVDCETPPCADHTFCTARPRSAAKVGSDRAS